MVITYVFLNQAAVSFSSGMAIAIAISPWLNPWANRAMIVGINGLVGTFNIYNFSYVSGRM
jgi:hypothetical protein